MVFTFFRLSSLCKDIGRKRKSIEHFQFTYSKVLFDVVLDIDSTPFQMMVGAKKHNLAFVLNIEKGYRTEIPDDIYGKLCSILNLSPNKDHFSSFAFLKHIDSVLPQSCSENIVNPDTVLYFRPYCSPNAEESLKTRFLGWNDHTTDGRKAHNFDKTERYLGKKIADFCRKHNISSMWTTPDDNSPRDITFPPGY